MLEALTIDAAQGFAAAFGGGAFGIIAWLGSKLWALHRHEVRGMKEVDTRTLDLLQTKMEADNVLHRDMHGTLREIRGFLAAKE